MPYLDSRSVPQRYTITVTVSRPLPSGVKKRARVSVGSTAGFGVTVGFAVAVGVGAALGFTPGRSCKRPPDSEGDCPAGFGFEPE